MGTQLSLERSLFKHQARQIARRVQTASPRFRAYQRRYEQATRRYRKVISLHEVDARVAASDIVFVGDYHTLRTAQSAYLELAQRSARSKRRLVLALEFVESRYQSVLDAFLAGRLTQRGFLMRIGHAPAGSFDLWRGFWPILEFAKKQKLEVVAIDRRASGPKRLQLRDEGAAKVISKIARAEDRPLVLVLMGQYHVAPAHLPHHVKAELKATPRELLVVYQNAEGIYWRLAAKNSRARAVEVSASELCLINSSPVICQRTFLDYVEAEGGDAVLPEEPPATKLQPLAQRIRKLARGA